MKRINDDEIAQMVVLRGLGYHIQDIATELGVSHSTIARKLTRLKGECEEEKEYEGILPIYERVMKPLMDEFLLGRIQESIKNIETTLAEQPKVATLKPVLVPETDPEEDEGFEGLGSLFG